MNDKHHIQQSSPIDKFLIFLKKETGEKEVSYFDAVFHRKFAKYRHLTYPDSKEDAWKSAYMIRTWINVILHEGMTDNLRHELFPKRFDLGNTSTSDTHKESLADLIDEIGIGTGDYFSKQDPRKLQTVQNGIKNTVGYDFSDTSVNYPMTSLKVISLLYKMTKLRKSSLFGLIKPPQHFEEKITIDFSDKAPYPMSESDSLIVADLISYLSIEVPEYRLRVINQHILTSSKLLDVCNKITEKIPDLVRAYHDNGEKEIVDAYNKMSIRIDKYNQNKPEAEDVPLDEALYVYLKTLELQHFSFSYEKLLKKINSDYSVKNIKAEMEIFCTSLSKKYGREIHYHTKITSVKGFADLARENEVKIMKLVKLATGFTTRKDIRNDIINYASKILSLYNLHSFDGKNLDAEVLSISECIAALCTITIQRKYPTKHEPFRFGLVSQGKSPLEFFDKERSVEELIETEYVPHSINQLMYRIFNNIYHEITGDDEFGIRHAFLEFEISIIKKFSECFKSCSIETIMLSEKRFYDYMMMVTIKYHTQPFPDYFVDQLNNLNKINID